MNGRLPDLAATDRTAKACDLYCNVSRSRCICRRYRAWCLSHRRPAPGNQCRCREPRS